MSFEDKIWNDHVAPAINKNIDKVPGLKGKIPSADIGTNRPLWSPTNNGGHSYEQNVHTWEENHNPLNQQLKPHNVPGLPNPNNPNPNYNNIHAPTTANVSFSNEDVLKKIEAYIQGPISARPDAPNVTHMVPPGADGKNKDHGQGDVKSKDDGRLKENQDKRHKELEEEALELEEGSSDDDAGPHHEESDDVKTPYERARVDHRAIFEHPAYGLMAKKAFQKASDLNDVLYQVRLLRQNASNQEEYNDLQAFASLVATTILKNS